MKNYSVYCLHSKVIFFTGTLQECYNNFKHSGGFGIFNKSTNKTVIYNPSNQWKVAPKLSEYFKKGMQIYNSSKITI